MAYSYYDLQNTLQQAQESIEDALYYCEELEDAEERVEQLEERVEELEKELFNLRDASNLQELIQWWLNNLNDDNKYKVWSLAYELMKEQANNELTFEQTEE